MKYDGFSDINIGVDSILLATEEDMVTEHFGAYQANEFIYMVHKIVDDKLRSKFYLRLVVA
jgi:hypothetical protein